MLLRHICSFLTYHRDGNLRLWPPAVSERHSSLNLQHEPPRFPFPQRQFLREKWLPDCAHLDALNDRRLMPGIFALLIPPDTLSSAIRCSAAHCGQLMSSSTQGLCFLLMSMHFWQRLLDVFLSVLPSWNGCIQ
jgi:hypothetical protein